jgi:hypothetical protein
MSNIKRIANSTWTEVTIHLKQFNDLDSQFSNIDSITVWLRENCQHEYNWSYIPGTVVRICRFADPNDALLFALKWS